MSVPGKRPQHGYKPLKPLKGPPVPPKPVPAPLSAPSTTTTTTNTTPVAVDARQKLLKTISAPFFDLGSEIGSTPESQEPFWARSMSMSAAATRPAVATTPPPALPSISKSMSMSVASRKALSPTGLNTLSEEKSVRFESAKTDGGVVSRGQTLDGTRETNSSGARATKPIPPIPPPKKKPLPLPPKARRPSDYLVYSPAKDTKLSISTSTSTVRSNGSSTVTDAPADIKSSESPSSSTSSSPSSTPSKTAPLTTASSQAPVARQQQHPVTFARPPPKEMEYTEREHPRTAFEYLDRMRRRGDLCDVTLVVDTEEIRAHKVVLAACSQYFEQMFIGEFAEPDNQPIFIDEVEEDALIALVDFSYTARIKLTDHNIYSLFEAADLLQFAGVKGACFKYFKQQINKSNCIRTWLFAKGHNCTELMEAALRYIQCNFLDIVRGREFLNLEQPDIVARLIQLEDLAISSEEQVYEAVLGWLHHEPRKRKEHTLQVMQNVRFPSMSRDYLMHIVDQEAFVKEDPDCLQLLIDALASHVSSMRTTLRRKLAKQNSSYTNMQPRPASMAVEVVDIYRDSHILGLRIMGGSDRPNHVFRQGEKSGIFILKVTDDGAAARVGKLRSGDRILRVCGTDMSSVSHEQAIRLLKMSPDPLTLLVRHEPPPPGLQELTLVTKPGEGFGFAISGGVNGYPGNPLDETDEGIFISQVIPGGAAEQDGRLGVGMRLLQVNSVSMLGKTHEEALQVLQGVLDRINLLVCYGYDPDSIPDTIDTVDEFGYVGSEPVYDRSQVTAVDSTTFARSESGAASR